jgi:hypothetical protein
MAVVMSAGEAVKNERFGGTAILYTNSMRRK